MYTIAHLSILLDLEVLHATLSPGALQSPLMCNVSHIELLTTFCITFCKLMFSLKPYSKGDTWLQRTIPYGILIVLFDTILHGSYIVCLL